VAGGVNGALYSYRLLLASRGLAADSDAGLGNGRGRPFFAVACGVSAPLSPVVCAGVAGVYRCSGDPLFDGGETWTVRDAKLCAQANGRGQLGIVRPSRHSSVALEAKQQVCSRVEAKGRRMTYIGRCAALLLMLTALGACGEGYVLKPAILNVTGTTDRSKEQLLTVVSGLLKQEGFEDFGRYDAMISLIQHGEMPESARTQELARLNRERTFLKDPSHLRIVWADYTSGEVPKGAIRYSPPSSHFIEISISEERPGGFSADGHLFYRRFLAALQQQYGTSVVVVQEPPPTDEAEYRRITVNHLIMGTINWLIAFSLTFLLTGFLSYRLLRKRGLSRTIKQLIFVMVNSWLIAPMPFQGGFIFVFLGPNLFAFPWMYTEYYRHFSSFAAVSFPCAALLCGLVSLFLFKGHPERKASNA
jgi:hypothetical protein